MEEKPWAPCGLSELGQAPMKRNVPEAELSAAATAVNCTDPKLTANNWRSLGVLSNGTPNPEASKASESEQILPAEECGEQTVSLAKPYAPELLERAANL